MRIDLERALLLGCGLPQVPGRLQADAALQVIESVSGFQLCNLLEQRIDQLGSAGLIVLIKRKLLVRVLASAQVAKGHRKSVMSGAIVSGQLTSGSVVTNSLMPMACCSERPAFAIMSLRDAGMLLQNGVVSFLSLAPFPCFQQ